MVHVENTGTNKVELAKGTAFLSGSTFITHVAVSEDVRAGAADVATTFAPSSATFAG